MNRKLILTILVAGVFSILACSNSSTSNKEATMEDIHSNSAKSTKQLPSFKIYDVNNNIIDTKSLIGKKVFVNLWATWCPPCRAEIPSIVKLSKSVDTSKVAFVMLSLDNDFDKAKKFFESKKYPLPVYYPAEELPALFNVQGIPTTFIFNEQGELIQQVDGGDNYNTATYKNMLGSK
jgi:thiol-disulfide isomerase/thioredoxin